MLCRDLFFQCGTILSLEPGKLLIGWGPRTKGSNAPLTCSPSFYFPDFFLSTPTPWFSHAQTQVITCESFLELLANPPQPQNLCWQNNSKDSFLATVQNIKDRIQAKELTKAVPFIFATHPAPLSTPQLHLSLVQAVRYVLNHPGYLYGTWDTQEGILGVTPETLFSVHRCQQQWMLKSVALAGTAPANHPLHDAKLLHEHQVVVDAITHALKAFGMPQVGPMQSLDLPHLRHLMTPIALSLHNVPSFIDLVETLHPTPALGAHPRAAGKSWLAQYQKNYNRLRFGAPVGFSEPNTQISRCFVAIRNVQWQPDCMLIGAGCGVVEGSDPDEEWNEVLLKIKAIKDLLAL